MLNKKIFVTKFSVGATALFAASALAGALWVGAPAPNSEATGHAQTAGAKASWISQAESVGQQVQEADLVVRVQAIDRAGSRQLWHPRPAGAERQDGGSNFVFTDTEVELLEVYAGQATVGDRLNVLQTGGELVDREGQRGTFELADDPLYLLGSEMVLFLVDISDDPIHAKGQALYRTVNPAGRYQVEGGLVSRSALGDGHKARISSELSLLETEISEALERKEG